MPEPAIRLSGVTKRYRLYGSVAERALDVLGLSALRPRRPPSYAEHTAIDGVDLEIGRGERVGIVGRNGAGKTTLLKLIGGNFAPTSGVVRVDGSVRALMSVGLGFHPEFSGRENIGSALLYNGLPEESIDGAVAEVADFAELGDYLDQPMRTYSQGMQARLMFAAATAVRPDILIVDEMLGAGDAYFTAKSAHRMRELTGAGRTLLLVSHSTQQILQFCDRVVWIEKGRARADGKALDVVRLYEEFVETMGASAFGEAISRPPASDFVTPRWQQESMGELFTGIPPGEISRWPGVPGLRVARLVMTDTEGVEKAEFRIGETIRIRILLAIEQAGVFPVRFGLLFTTEAGTPITRVLSPYFEVRSDSAGEKIFEVTLPHPSFTQQSVVFSIAVFKTYEPECPQFAVRYELLARSFRFRVVGGIPNDPGIVTIAADWLQAGRS